MVSLTSALLAAMLRKVTKVNTPSMMQRPQTMPKATMNLREMGRFLSQAMPVTLSDATQGFIGVIGA